MAWSSVTSGFTFGTIGFSQFDGWMHVYTSVLVLFLPFFVVFVVKNASSFAKSSRIGGASSLSCSNSSWISSKTLPSSSCSVSASFFSLLILFDHFFY